MPPASTRPHEFCELQLVIRSQFFSFVDNVVCDLISHTCEAIYLSWALNTRAHLRFGRHLVECQPRGTLCAAGQALTWPVARLCSMRCAMRKPSTQVTATSMAFPQRAPS